MYALSSIQHTYAAMFLPRRGEPHLPTTNKCTFRKLNTDLLPKKLLGEVMRPT